VVIGTDTAEMGAVHLERAFAALAGHDRAVLGPAADGGYYLLGLTRFSPAAFDGIAFGGNDVAATTCAALATQGFEIHLLPTLSDLDSAHDVRALLTRLRGSHRRQDEALHRILLDLLASGFVDHQDASPGLHLDRT